jgi:DNA-binding response OmpR family regulator
MVDLVLILAEPASSGDILQRELHESGFLTLIASTQRIALACLGKITPRVILVDLDLPGDEGWAFLRSRSDDERLLGIPAVVLSAMTGLALHPDTWALEKPLQRGALVSLLRELCTGRSDRKAMG